MPNWDEMVFWLTNEGGFAIAPLAVGGVIALAIVLERSYRLWGQYDYRPSFFDPILLAMKQGHYEHAWSEFRKTDHLLGKLLVVCLENSQKSREGMESAVNLELQNTVPKIQAKLHYLQMIGGVATLLGLLGTIAGLIQSFDALTSADNQKEALATGISTAMGTTFVGLCLAIPCVMAYSVLNAKQNQILQKYQHALNTVIHYIYFGEAVVAAKRPSGRTKVREDQATSPSLKAHPSEISDEIKLDFLGGMRGHEHQR
jgi:biopolymer transport protein ExbB